MECANHSSRRGRRRIWCQARQDAKTPDEFTSNLTAGDSGTSDCAPSLRVGQLFIGHTGSMVSIRSARPGDSDAVSALIHEAFAPYIERIGTEPAPMATDYPALIDTGAVWVAEDDGQLVGTIVLTPKPDHLLLDNLAVPAVARGLGIGVLLLDFAAEHGRALGVSEVRLYTNAAMTENLDFYPRRGFVETHRSSVDGFDRVFFTKQL